MSKYIQLLDSLTILDKPMSICPNNVDPKEYKELTEKGKALITQHVTPSIDGVWFTQKIYPLKDNKWDNKPFVGFIANIKIYNAKKATLNTHFYQMAEFEQKENYLTIHDITRNNLMFSHIFGPMNIDIKGDETTYVTYDELCLKVDIQKVFITCLLYTSPSPRDRG